MNPPVDDAASRVSPRLVLGLANYARPGEADWPAIVDAAVAAEEAGFDRLVVSDHVAFGATTDDYARPELGGVEGGRQPTGPDGHWLEPLTFLTFVAARTSRIRLGTNILLAALRRPVVLAKVVATLDVLSGGRVDLGVGVGWQRAEYEAAGLDFARRGRLLDRSLEVCTSLWAGAPVDDESAEPALRGIWQLPSPSQPAGVPVWVSGTLNRGVVRRLARFGHGWIPWGGDARDVPSAVGGMRRLVAAEGRDPGAIGVLTYLPLREGSGGRPDLSATFAGVRDAAAAGVTDFRVPFAAPEGGPTLVHDLPSVVEAFAEAVGR